MSSYSLTELCKHLRYDIALMSHRGRAAHLGSSLSCVEIIAVLYDRILTIDPKKPQDPQRDIFLLSKGHGISTLYAVLAYKGFFPKEDLLSFNQNGSFLPEHPTPYCTPGVEFATGSLGHGLSVALGIAYAAKLKDQPKKIFVLLSDGECNEGSVWEAAMLAPKKNLPLVVFIDYNKWQATDRSDNVMQLSPLKEKWQAFGWHAMEIDGHNIDEIEKAAHKALSLKQPVAIVAHTIKGKGFPFMEDDNNWHYRIPNEEDLQKCRESLSILQEMPS
jgi:transketolase